MREPPYIETPFGYVPLEGITEIIDVDGNKNYTLGLIPKSPEPNTFYNLIVNEGSTEKGTNAYVMEYKMGKRFIENVLFKEDIEDSPNGIINKYPVDYFIGDSFNKSTPPCPCDKSSGSSSSSSGSSDDGYNPWGSTSGNGSTTTGGTNNGGGGSSCNIHLDYTEPPTARWGEGGSVIAYVFCANTNINKSSSKANCPANNEGDCPGNSGTLAADPVAIVTYLELRPPLSLHFLLSINQDLANSGAKFLYKFRNSETQLAVAKQTLISGMEAMNNGPFSKPQLISFLEADNVLKKVVITASIKEAVLASLITTTQADKIMNFIDSNGSTEESLDFANAALEGLESGGKADFEDEVILDSEFLKTPAYCVYNELKKQNGNLFKQTIGSFIDDPEYNLYFRVGECEYTDQACTDGTTTSKGVMTIILENTGISSLNAAATLLHEGIHAELFRFVDQVHNEEVDPNNRKRLLSLYGIYKQLGWEGNSIPGQAQHVYMAENYITPIAKSIRELDDNKYPLEYYMGFGWDGLRAYAYTGLLSDEDSKKFDRLKNIVDNNTTFNPNNCN